MNMKIKTLLYFLLIINIPLLLFGQNFPDLPESEDTPRSFFSRKDSINSLKSLKEEIDEVLKNANLSRTDYSIAIYSLDQDEYIYEKNINDALTPASNTKLFTTFTVLSLFGKDYHIPTIVYADEKPGKDSILNGNLYIVGNGDALLSVTDIEYIADELRNSGIKQINGNIYGDDTFFDSITDRKLYAGDDDHVEKLPPITALCIEKNIVQILVRAGSINGEKVQVQTIPASDAFRLDIDAKVTGGRKSGKNDDIEMDNIDLDLPEEYYGNYQEHPVSYYGGGHPAKLASSGTGRIYISSKLGDDGYQDLRVSGSLRAGRTYYYSYHILNPALAVAGALKDRLNFGGIPVNGDIGKKSINDMDSLNKPIFYAVFQRPITDILYLVNKNSDNYLAETMFKMIGAYQNLDNHTGRSCQKAMRKLFHSKGINCENCQLNDGSGLSRRNLCTTGSIIELLRNAFHSDFYAVFDSTLSIAGIDGTLEKRMLIGLAENNLRGKTGTLRNVSALSGYVNTLDGERLAFSFIFNGPNVGLYKSLEDELGEILSQFFYYNVEN